MDGDKADECKHCIKLPGGVSPERLIFRDLKKDTWKNLDTRFGLGAGELFKYFDDAMLLKDPHQWTQFIGDKVKQSKDYVWAVFVEEWCKTCAEPEDINSLVQKIEDILDKIV
ncbi:MAG: hypothetical protein LBT46_04020 [Planctomycetaceae bacterium]|nr:hypothetical protein [Planctomycetaceae bacterium]